MLSIHVLFDFITLLYQIHSHGHNIYILMSMYLIMYSFKFFNVLIRRNEKNKFKRDFLTL